MSAPARKSPDWHGGRFGAGVIGDHRQLEHNTSAPSIYRPGTRDRVDLTPNTVWNLVQHDGCGAVVKHPKGGTLAVPASRVWLVVEGRQP